MCKSSAIQKTPIFFSSLLLLSFSEFGAAHFGSVLPFAARDPGVPAPKLKVCLSLKTDIKNRH